MLEKHFAAWQDHPKEIFEYIIIDDCSITPITIQQNISNFSVFRIDPDIPWNVSGARNLGFHVASNEWVLCADIDHVVTSSVAQKLLTLDLTNSNIAYVFKRIRERDGYVGCKAAMNILINKKRYWQIGGYDEDFSGHYWKEDIFFLKCLQYHQIQMVYVEDIFLSWHPEIGSTRRLSRDKSHNISLFEKKSKALLDGQYKNGNVLRFNWKYQRTR